MNVFGKWGKLMNSRSFYRLTYSNMQWTLHIPFYLLRSFSNRNSHCKLTECAILSVFSLFFIDKAFGTVGVYYKYCYCCCCHVLNKENQQHAPPPIMCLPTRLFLYTHTPTIDWKQKNHIHSQRIAERHCGKCQSQHIHKITPLAYLTVE